MAKYAKLFQKLITAEVERLSNMIDKTITPLTSKVLPIFYALAITGSVIGVSIAAIGVHKGGIFNLDRRGAIELLVPIVLVLAMLIFLICCRIINKINYDKDKYQEQVVRLEYLQKLTTSDIANDIIFYDKLNALQYNALTVFYALAIIGSGIGVGITAIGVHKGGIFNLDRRGAIELLVPIVLVLAMLIFLACCRVYNAIKETKYIQKITNKIGKVVVPDLSGLTPEALLKELTDLCSKGFMFYGKEEGGKYAFGVFNKDNGGRNDKGELNQGCIESQIKHSIARESGIFSQSTQEVTTQEVTTQEATTKKVATKEVSCNVYVGLNVVERVFNDFAREGGRNIEEV